MTNEETERMFTEEFVAELRRKALSHDEGALELLIAWENYKAVKNALARVGADMRVHIQHTFAELGRGIR